MIHEVSGDILLTNCQAIAHGVAPDDHFEHGLALALREKFPVMTKDFRHYAHQCHPKVGEIWAWGGFDKRIYNLLTQDNETGRGGKAGPATGPSVSHCLKRLRHALEKDEVKSLALPKLATGVGGLDWAEVYPLIKQHLGDLNIPIFIYTTYHKGVKATEAGV